MERGYRQVRAWSVSSLFGSIEPFSGSRCFMTALTPRQRERAVRMNVMLLRLVRHWLRVALVLLGIYVTLPFVAPTLMQVGLTRPAAIIYALYSPFCHQFAFRTFFLYGEQPFYPRAIVNDDLKPYEEFVADSPEFAAAVDQYRDLLRGQPFDA